MTYYFPTKEELIKYFNGKSEKVFVHYFNIATYFLKKEELLSLPPEQRHDYFQQKIKKLPVSAQRFYYEKLTELSNSGFLLQEGFGFKLTVDKGVGMSNESYYLRDILASGNSEVIALAHQYCEKQAIELAIYYLSNKEKQKYAEVVAQLKR